MTCISQVNPLVNVTSCNVSSLILHSVVGLPMEKATHPDHFKIHGGVELSGVIRGERFNGFRKSFTFAETWIGLPNL